MGLALAMLAASCSSVSKAEPDARLDLVALDYGYTSETGGEVEAGAVEISVRNDGPTTHELILTRTDQSSDSLPLESDGLTVAEGSPQLPTRAAIEDVPLDATHYIRVDLEPGNYVAYCNLEGHYLAGMHMQLTVTEPG